MFWQERRLRNFAAVKQSAVFPKFAERGIKMIRMPDDKNKNPFTNLSSLLKRKPGSQKDAEEDAADAEEKHLEEKVKEVIKRKVER